MMQQVTNNYLPPDPVLPLPALDTSAISVPVSRFSLADFPECEEYLRDRLISAIPQISLMNYRSWMTSWINSNEHLFLKAPNAIGLAGIAYDPMEPRPVIQMIFLFCEGNEHLSQVIKIVREWERWGKTLGARELNLTGISEVAQGKLKSLITGTEQRTELVLKMDR